MEPYDSLEPAGGSSLPVIILVLVLLGLAVFLAYLWRMRARAQRAALLNLRALRVTLPRSRQEGNRRDPKELIALMEPVYATLQHFAVHKAGEAFWKGQPTFSFELTAKAGELFFHVLAPQEYLEPLERQIHAQYPDAHIESSTDYEIFLEKGGRSAVGALKLLKSHIFPIRTYKALEGDPLNAIANSLSKVGAGQGAIQIVLQPALHAPKEIERALQNAQEGKAFTEQRGMKGVVGTLAQDVKQSTVGSEGKKEEVHQPPVRLTALQEQQAKLLVEKGSKAMLQAQIRVVARAETEEAARAQVQTMLSAFTQYLAPESNGFKVTGVGDRALLTAYIFRAFSRRQPTLLLTTEELASLYHFPNTQVESPTIHWLGARKLAPPTNLPTSGVALGYTNFRGSEQPVYLTYPDRMRHLYMIGKTGVGKTVMFQNMVLQDIRNGYGACYLDPNGDAIEWILRHIPAERLDDVILIDPSDTAFPLGLNLLEYDPQFPEQKTMVINELIAIFDVLYDLRQTGGPIFEQYMRNAMLLIMEQPGSTLMEISKVLADAEFRKQLLARCANQVVVDFWTKEAEKAGGDAALANMVPYITSKLTQFTSNDIMRPIIGQPQSSFNFRQAMDERKIILVSLPKGLLGEMNARLLGMIISGKIQLAAFSRQNQPEEQRVPFFLYVDEFQNFKSRTFATILSEARKYRLSLNITHQYVEQLDEETRGAVIGNVGTLVAWRIGVSDAEFLQKELAPVTVDDLVSSEKFSFYLRMLIDGAPAQPFNVQSYAPDPNEDPAMAQRVRERSRAVYGRPLAQVEEAIRQRVGTMVPSGQSSES